MDSVKGFSCHHCKHVHYLRGSYISWVYIAWFCYSLNINNLAARLARIQIDNSLAPRRNVLGSMPGVGMRGGQVVIRSNRFVFSGISNFFLTPTPHDRRNICANQNEHTIYCNLIRFVPVQKARSLYSCIVT